MNDFLERIGKLSPKRLALLALELQSKLESAGRRREPVAIIGLGCRFPGRTDGPDAFWKLLSERRDAIVEVPADRWDIDAFYDPDPDRTGKMNTRWGGFLDRVDMFEPQLFGISPREAASMDPQQRLLLEVAWEALEHAGHAPDGLAKSRTGVFVGICGSDYYHLLMESAPGASNTYVATGTTHSVASGRISYVLGLQGPSLSVDTACSSSLVAVHLACQSLNDDECRMALAGGVNAILSPEPTVALSAARMMAPDGRCKAFDARANGFVRGEGCGLVVLKRLSDAVADGDRVLAVIHGSAINQDGRSSGLTAPNGPSQEAVIREALARAGVAPAEISYVEAHGTGTSLGDPIEVQALAAALGAGRPEDRPLMIGSVKTNIGHLEAAAGIAGLIKVVLALQHRRIPAHLHLERPNPHIRWDGMAVRVATEAQAWPGGGRRIAGVSSFGFSGTNAHVVVGEAPASEPASPSITGRRIHLCCLSARSAPALREQASRLARHLEANPALEPGDVCFTLNQGRALFAHRAALAAATLDELRAELSEIAQAPPAGAPVAGPPEIAFLFTGQGSQYAGMGRALYETEPVFRSAMDRCAELLGDLTPGLLPVLYGPDSALLDETRFTQPALFALEYALAELWASWGIRPSFALGHSVGEYVAACIAGVMSLEDALRLVAARGRLMQALPAGGAMAAVLAGRHAVEPVVRRYAPRLAIAAVNGPGNTVISGQAEALEAAVGELEREGWRAQRLAVSHAFHSPLLDPMLDEFERLAGATAYKPPRIGLVSNNTGAFMDAGQAPTASYWRRHAREPVDFAAGMRALHDEGCRVFLEIGPSPVLIGMGKQCLSDSAAAWIPTLRRGADDWKQLLGSMAELYLRGARLDWQAVERGRNRRRIALPTYPFERQRCWLENAERTRQAAAKAGQDGGGGAHPLLGQPVESARGEVVFPVRLGLERQPYLRDHRLHGMCLVPAPVYMELAAAAVRECFHARCVTLTDVAVLQPLVLGETDGEAQVIVNRDAESRICVEVFSRDAAGWVRHATAGALTEEAAADREAGTAAAEDLRRGAAEAGAGFYARLRASGVEFGPCFQGIDVLWRGDGEAAAAMRVPAGIAAQAAAYQLHPAIADSCLQLLGASLGEGGPDASGEKSYLMVAIDRYVLRRPPGETFRGYARIRDAARDGDLITGDIFLTDDQGHELGRMEGVRLKRARREALLRSAHAGMEEWLYEIQWRAAGDAPAAPQAADRFAAAQIAGVGSGVMEALAREHDLDGYARLTRELEELATAFLWRALDWLGWRPQSGEALQAGSLAAKLGVVPRHRRLFGRLLEMLEEDGNLARTQDGWRVVRGPEPFDPAARASAIRARHPQFGGEVALLESCGQALGAVLRGERDALQLLFPGGSMTAVERLTQESPAARAYNALVRRSVEAAIASAGTRPLRVLEIGAGTGGTTASVLPALPADRTEYVFTDISRLFLSRAEEKFRAYPFVRYRLLDIESDPAGQGFDPQAFDIVIAANVLYATGDLRRTLANTRRLLAPSGLLILLEGMAPQRWVDLTFGLTEGWWKFADFDLRPSHPLLSREGWLKLLAAADFRDPAALTQAPAGGLGQIRQAVIVATAGEAPQIARGGSLRLNRRWLLVGEGDGIAGRLGEMLTEAGAGFVRASGGERPEDFDRLLAALPVSSPETITEVVDLLGCEGAGGAEPDLQSIDRQVTAGCRSALYLAQALVRAQRILRPRLWLVTRDCQPAGREQTVLNVGQSCLWGLGRTIASEHPEIWGGLVDVDSDIGRAASSIAAEVGREPREDQAAYRQGRRYSAFLSRAGAAPPPQPVRLRDDRTYLVTGGTGGMGLKVAGWLAENGARHVVLTGRSGAVRMAREEQQMLDARGARIVVRAADAASEDDMRRIFAEIAGEGPPLAGVVHAAGIFDDRVLMRHDWDRFEKVLAPKVRGGWILHHLTKSLPLDFFVLFSSGASFLAPVGLGNYAAGNAFLDALAHYRRRLGLPAISIDWGPWEKVGMAGAVGGRREDQWTQAGFVTMTPEQGLAAMERLIAGGAPQSAVLIVDWIKYARTFGAAVPPFFADLVRQPRKAAARPVAAPAPVLEVIRRAPPAERRALLAEHVCANVIEVLGFEKSQPLDTERGLFDLGMDSLTAVELKNRLQSAFGRHLPSTLLFDYPNVQKLSDYLFGEVFEEGPRQSDKGESHHRALTEDELARLLSEKLEQLG